MAVRLISSPVLIYHALRTHIITNWLVCCTCWSRTYNFSQNYGFQRDNHTKYKK